MRGFGYAHPPNYAHPPADARAWPKAEGNLDIFPVVTCRFPVVPTYFPVGHSQSQCPQCPALNGFFVKKRNYLIISIQQHAGSPLSPQWNFFSVYIRTHLVYAVKQLDSIVSRSLIAQRKIFPKQ